MSKNALASTPTPLPAPAPRRNTLNASPERLYGANTALVGLILARQFAVLPPGLREDAYGAGLFGLWQAAQRYDPSLGFTFATFAGDYIRGHILHLLKREHTQARLPVVSLETPIGDKEQELADVVPDPQAERPGARLESSAGFDALLWGLPELQQGLLRAVYQQGKTLADVAGAWGVSKQRAGQVHLQALKKIRKKHLGHGSYEQIGT